MSKYRLGYKKDGIIKSVDLSKLEYLKESDVFDILTIDNFTMNFVSKQELLDYLKHKGLIDSSVFDIFIVKERRDKETKEKYLYKIYKGEVLFFKGDSEYTTLSYLYSYIMNRKNDSEFIVNLVNTYYHKYNKNGSAPSYINYVFDVIKRLGSIGYARLDYRDKNFYIDALEDFVVLEFFRYELDNFNGILYKKKVNNQYVKNNINVRTFGVFIKELESMKNGKKLTEKVDGIVEENEHEEFLTLEDFDEVNKAILKTYSPEDTEAYEDGYDVIKPLSKNELKNELNILAKRLVNENH